MMSECDKMLRLVTGNNICNVGAQALAKALEANRTLTSLDLSRASDNEWL
jgi:hypothetical protein